jgi:hypothetical protein
MRRVRRSRIKPADLDLMVHHLIVLSLDDTITMEYLTTGQKNKAFGRMLNRWINKNKESVIDIYIDEDAFKVVNFAIYQLTN